MTPNKTTINNATSPDAKKDEDDDEASMTSEQIKEMIREQAAKRKALFERQ